MIAEPHAEQVEHFRSYQLAARQTPVTESISGASPGRQHFSAPFVPLDGVQQVDDLEPGSSGYRSTR